MSDDVDPQDFGDPPLREELRILLQRERDVPPLLARALDRIPDGWALLWVQRELLRLGDPKHHERAKVVKPHHRFLETQARSVLKLIHPPPLKDVEKGDKVRNPPDVRAHKYDLAEGVIKLPPHPERGGAPPSLLRRLVEELDTEFRKEAPRPERAEKLERMAPLLKPFFPPTFPTREPDETMTFEEKLARTYDNV